MPSIHRLLRVKLRPLTQLLLLAGLAAAAFAGLGMSIVREEWDQNALSSQIKLGEQVLTSAAAARHDQEELQARLSAAQQELATAHIALPDTLDSRDVLETVLARVVESQVSLIRIETRPPAVKIVGDDEEHEYTVSGFDLEVEGEFRQMTALLAALEDGDIGTIAIGAFDLRQVEGRHALSLELLAFARTPTADADSAEDGPSTGGAVEAGGGGEGAAVQ